MNRMELFNSGKYLQLDEIVDVKSLFGNVKELILDDSFAIKSRFLSDAKELTRLTLSTLSFKRVNAFLSNQYPKLQSLSMNKRRTESHTVKLNSISNFWKCHPYLLEMELIGCGVYDLSSIAKLLSPAEKTIHLRLWL